MQVSLQSTGLFGLLRPIWKPLQHRPLESRRQQACPGLTDFKKIDELFLHKILNAIKLFFICFRLWWCMAFTFLMVYFLDYNTIISFPLPFPPQIILKYSNQNKIIAISMCPAFISVAVTNTLNKSTGRKVSRLIILDFFTSFLHVYIIQGPA